jgi:hypothetical protein
MLTPAESDDKPRGLVVFRQCLERPRQKHGGRQPFQWEREGARRDTAETTLIKLDAPGDSPPVLWLRVEYNCPEPREQPYAPSLIRGGLAVFGRGRVLNSARVGVPVGICGASRRAPSPAP